MSRSSAAALTAMVLAAVASRGALAEQPTVVLEVERATATDDCVGHDQLVSAVEQRLARTVFGSEGAWGTVEVRYEQVEPVGFVARVLLLDSSGNPLGEREIKTEASHCSALDDSLALVIALLVDEPLLSAPPAEPAQRPKPTAIELPPATHAPRAEWGFEPGGCMVVTWGVLPGVALGARPRLGVTPPPGLIPVYIDATFYFGVTEQEGSVGADFRHWNLGVSVCPRTSLGSADQTLYGCLGQRSGALGAHGFGFDRNLQPSRLFFALALELGMSFRLAGPVWLSAALEGGVPLQRDRFVFANSEGARLELHRPSLVTVSGVAGAEIRL